MCRRIISAIVFYFMGVLCFNIRNSFQLPNDFNLNNQSWSNYIDQSNHIFSFNNNKCSRYCMETQQDHDNITRATIIWNIADNFLLAFYDATMKSSGETEDINKPTKCVFYVNIGCENLTSTDEIINNLNEHVKFDRTTIGNSEKIFIVNYETKLLDVQIAKEKNTSSLLLEFPIELRRTANNDVLELSLKRNTATNKLHAIIINPSPGKWRLYLNRMGTINLIDSVYSNHNMMVMKKSTMSIMRSNKRNLPEKLQSRSSDYFEIHNNGDENTMKVNSDRTETLNKYARIVTNNNNKMIINEKSGMLNDLVQTSSGLAYKIKTIMIDIAPETSLIASPNTNHPIIFIIKNYLPLTMHYTFDALISFSSQFPMVHFEPLFRWLEPELNFKITVYIRIPNVNDDITATVTLRAYDESNLEDVTKSAYVYVKNSNTMVGYFAKPTINYSFNDNCAGKLSKDQCGDSEWSTKVTVTDSESGVKNVVSQPNGIQSKINFIAGTKEPVHFIYRSTCCLTTVRITAINVAGNSYTQEIDVTAWDNLLMGDIVAIVIGTLFLLLIIILLIVLCIYCIKKKKSTDITFTQRYGSRSTPRAEGTNF